VTGCTTIVDSSKDPYYGWALEHAPDVAVSVAHLVRDPRGAEFSRARKHGPGGLGLVRSALGWDFGHVAAEVLWSGEPRRYVRIRYEDFVARPHETAAELRRLVGAADGAGPEPSSGIVELPVHHTVSGNRNRFEAGSTQIRLDDAWQTGLSERHRRLVTGLTRPLLRRYGYAA
jgi:hypothetical protein